MKRISPFEAEKTALYMKRNPALSAGFRLKPDPIWKAGEKGVLLVTKEFKMHKRDKKTGKKELFLAALFPIEIRTISPIISIKYADFLVLTPVYGVRGQAGIVGLGFRFCLRFSIIADVILFLLFNFLLE